MSSESKPITASGCSAFLLFALLAPTPTSAAELRDDVWPILERSCFGCHGPGEQMGGLRLDAREAVLTGGDRGPVVQPGDPADSRLLARISGDSGGPRMPLGGEPLAADQIAAIRSWIADGAEWPAEVGVSIEPPERHWAYVPPERPAPPDIDSDWVRNPVDAFVLARLREEGLEPSPEADPAVLLRRAYLDVIGLPPTVEEADAFLSDSRPEAYAELLESLFASPHHGERWARWWLDLARYADTNGYEKDRERSLWPYRDWVIEAFNRNLPFDRFTVEQLAGDLLPDPTRDQLVATGFHRNTLINDEGGAKKEEFRIAAVMDRVNTTGTVWLGSTLECAQCHNHKFDPFTQRDYYSFLAFFNDTEPDVAANSFNMATFGYGPEIEVPTEDERREREKWTAAIRQAENELDDAVRRGRDYEAWAERVGQARTEWRTIEPAAPDSTMGARLETLDDHSVLASGDTPEDDVYLIYASTEAARITGLRLVGLPHDSLPGGGPGRGPDGSFTLTGVEVKAIPKPDEHEGDDSAEPETRRVRFSAALASSGDPTGAYDDDKLSGWSPQDPEPDLVLLPETPFGAATGSRLEIRLRFEGRQDGRALGRFRLELTTSELPAAESVAPRLTENPPTDGLARRYYRATAFPELWSEIDRARRRYDAVQPATTLVMRERTEPRKTHVFNRGNYLDPQEPVEPGAPDALHALEAGAGRPDRLDLARWLVDRDNPLTARVTVNRIWQEYFGAGLVLTPEDFGTRGERPTHPKLLDWLAVELMDSGWNLRHLHRLILTSSTYRQSSKVGEELLERDPYNRLLARGPRFRAPAETIRDIALTVSGLLEPKIGGPSVFPPQPEGVLRNAWGYFDGSVRWNADTGPDRYRRGIYTYFKRTAPYPFLLTFDAPRREVCTVQRPRTNTPLQALNTLNDPVFVEAALALAERSLREAGRDERELARYAFRRTLTRAPSEGEIDDLVALYRTALKRYQLDPGAAARLTDSAPWTPDDDLSRARLAAWTVVANALLNLDETITKG